MIERGLWGGRDIESLVVVEESLIKEGEEVRGFRVLYGYDVGGVCERMVREE